MVEWNSCKLSLLQNLTKINTFSWAKIRKLSFKRKKFLVKVRNVHVCGNLNVQNMLQVHPEKFEANLKKSSILYPFYFQVHPESYGYPCKDLIEFHFENRDECKSFWKKCIEHHSFFRCLTTKKGPRKNARLFSRGSSFRYAGRTQKEMVEFIRENYCKQVNFKQVTRGHNIVVDGWAGASYPNSYPMLISHTKKTSKTLIFALFD